MHFRLSPYAIRPGPVDRDYLTGVQESFKGTGIVFGWEAVVLFFLFLLALILIVLLLRVIFKPGKVKFGSAREHLITDQDAVQRVVQRSVDHRSLYDLEVFHPDYKEIYRGQILGLNDNDEIDMELSSFTDPSLDFADKDVRVAFDVSRRGNKEFYQFGTVSHGIGYTTRYGRKYKAVRLAMPQIIEMSQKRQHLRVHPTGSFSFKVNLIKSVLPGDRHSLLGFRRVHKADVTDISVGGLQAVLITRTRDLKIRVGEEIIARIAPQSDGLGLEEIPGEFIIKAKVVSIWRRPTGRRVMSREMDDLTEGPHEVRLQFTARGNVDRDARLVTFRPAAPMVFEDLARWIQAYQRHEIQKKRGTLPQPEKLRNQYPRVPLDVKPRYPSEPLSRKKPRE